MEFSKTLKTINESPTTTNSLNRVSQHGIDVRRSRKPGLAGSGHSCCESFQKVIVTKHDILNIDLRNQQI